MDAAADFNAECERWIDVSSRKDGAGNLYKSTLRHHW